MTIELNIRYKQETGLDPIPAQCKKCGKRFEGGDAIRCPSLSACRCFYCGGVLVPIDPEAEREAITRWVHKVNQLAQEMDEVAASIHPDAWNEQLADLRDQFVKVAQAGPGTAKGDSPQPVGRKRKKTPEQLSFDWIPFSELKSREDTAR